MSRDNWSKINEIINKIDDAENVEDISTKDITSLKKLYTIFSSEQRMQENGCVREDLLDRLSKKLLNKYDILKSSKTINEILELVADDYEYMAEVKDLQGVDKANIDEKIDKIKERIMPNSKSILSDMSIEEVEEFIREKINDKGINDVDISNILKNQADNMGYDIEGFQKLIENTIIPIVDRDLKNEYKSIDNPAVFDILHSYAESFNYQGEYYKCKEIYDKIIDAADLNEMQSEGCYTDLMIDYTQICRYLKKEEKNFDVVSGEYDLTTYDSLENFLESLELENGVDNIEQFIFHKGLGDHRDKKNDSKGRNDFKMSVSDKLKGIDLLFRGLKDKYPDREIKISQIKIGKDAYNGYIVFPISGTNITVMDRFDEEENDALYIAQNDKVDKMISMAKNRTKTADGVVKKKHLKDFNVYVDGIIRDAIALNEGNKITRTRKKNEINQGFDTAIDEKIEDVINDNSVDSPVIEESVVPKNEGIFEVEEVEIANEVEEINEVEEPKELSEQELDSEIERVSAENSNLSDKIQKLLDKRDKLKEEAAKRERMKAKKDELNGFNDENERLKTMYAELMEEVDKLESELESDSEGKGDNNE